MKGKKNVGVESPAAPIEGEMEAPVVPQENVKVPTEKPIAKGSVTVVIEKGRLKGTMRVFSKEDCGEDFMDRAQSFADKFGGKVVKN